ncbi:Non-homologous end joining protein Ku [Bienertia sinuspersici]
MIIHLDGRLEEFNQPITVSHIVSKHPNCFVANSEFMYVDSIVLPIPNDDELELGQIYFLLPLSQAHKVFSLQDLCGLAIKASIALGLSNMKRSPSNVVKIVAQARTSCSVFTGFDAISVLNYQARQSYPRIGL